MLFGLTIYSMNQFQHDENCNAVSLAKAAAVLASMYAKPEDLHAATIAILRTALELAGGKVFLKTQGAHNDQARSNPANKRAPSRYRQKPASIKN